MSYCNFYIPTNATVIPVDSRFTSQKVVLLPQANTVPGKILTIKDQYGTARISSFTISTIANNTIDSYTNNYRFTSSLQSVTLFSDGVNNWRSLYFLSGLNNLQSPFSPSSFSTLALWVDASDPWNRGSLSTVTRTVLPIWYDKSGAQRNLRWSTTDGTLRIQSTVNTGITSGVSSFTVRMETNLYVLNNPNTISSGNTGNTMVSLLRGGGEQPFFAGNAAFQKRWYRNGLGNYEASYGTSNTVSQSNLNNNFGVASFVWSPSTTFSYVRINGNAFGTGVFRLSSIQNVADRFYIGGQPAMGGQSFRAFTGNFGEILYYNSNLPSSQIAILEGYLAWKWGTQGGLNNNHPYRFVTPSSYDVSSPT